MWRGTTRNSAIASRRVVLVSFITLIASAGCWSQGGSGVLRSDGGFPPATRVDASAPGAVVPADGGGADDGHVNPSGGGGPTGTDGGVVVGGRDDAGLRDNPQVDGGAPAPVNGGQDAGGQQNGGGTFACGDIVGCASHCNNVATCRMQCRSYGEAAEQAKYDAVYYCVTVHGCTEPNCGFAFCSNEIAACRANGKSCSAVLQCADTCPDDACEQACIATGTAYARQLIDMIVSCAQLHGCNDAACAWASCRAQINACLAI